MTLDLRNLYLFRSGLLPEREEMEQGLDRVFHGIPWKVEGVLLGVSNCPRLLEQLDASQGQKVLSAIKHMGYQVFFSIPPLTESQRQAFYALWCRLRNWNRTGLIDCVVVDDPDTGTYLREVYRLSVALGERMTRGRISYRENDCLTGNELGFGIDLLEEHLRTEAQGLGAKFLLARMPRNGLCVASTEQLELQMIVGYRESFDGVCPLAREQSCHGECTRSMYQLLQDDGETLVLCGNALGRMERLTDGIVKTVLENRVAIVVPPVWREML